MLLSVVGVWPPHDAAKDRLAGHNLYHVLEATAADSASLNLRPCSGTSVLGYNQAEEAMNARSHPLGATVARSKAQASEGGDRGWAVIPLVNKLVIRLSSDGRGKWIWSAFIDKSTWRALPNSRNRAKMSRITS